MLIALDLDGTVWDHLDISSLYPPFLKKSAQEIVDSRGVPVRLREGVREFLATARERGHILSTLSWNDYNVAYQALKAFEIDQYFHYLVIEPHSRKDKMLYNLLRRIKAERGVELRPQDVLYVDDRDIHIGEIWSNIGPVRFIQFGRDVKNFWELLKLL